MSSGEKAPDAFRTIGELSAELGVAQHILRYWESKFAQLRPLQRAGNRRYYRPADVDLARRIQRLLSEEGYTVRGVQKLLASKTIGVRDAAATPAPDAVPSSVPELAPSSVPSSAPAFTPAAAPAAPPSVAAAPLGHRGIDVTRLTELRDRLAAALHG